MEKIEIATVEKLYKDKENTPHPILNRYLEKRWEIYKDNPGKREQILNPKEEYLKNRRSDPAFNGKPAVDSESKTEWIDAWQDQYWHLFDSWIKLRKKEGAITLGQATCTELCIWLYEVQGIFASKEKLVLEAISCLGIEDFPKPKNASLRNKKIIGSERMEWEKILEVARRDS